MHLVTHILALQRPTDPFMDSTHPWFAASYGARTDRASLLVSAEDLGDTTVRNSQLSRDHTGSDAVVGHLHYLVSDVIWQRPPVDEHAAKLVHPTLAQRGGNCATVNNKRLKNNKKQKHIQLSQDLKCSLKCGLSIKLIQPVLKSNGGLFAMLVTFNGTQFTHIIILDIFKRASCQIHPASVWLTGCIRGHFTIQFHIQETLKRVTLPTLIIPSHAVQILM